MESVIQSSWSSGSKFFSVQDHRSSGTSDPTYKHTTAIAASAASQIVLFPLFFIPETEIYYESILVQRLEQVWSEEECYQAEQGSQVSCQTCYYGIEESFLWTHGCASPVWSRTSDSGYQNPSEKVCPPEAPADGGEGGGSFIVTSAKSPLPLTGRPPKSYCNPHGSDGCTSDKCYNTQGWHDQAFAGGCPTVSAPIVWKL